MPCPSQVWGRCGLFNGRSCHWRHPHRGAEGGTVSARCLVTVAGAAPAAAALSSPGLLLLLILTGTRVVVVVVVGTAAVVLVAPAVVLALAPRAAAVLLLPGLRKWKANGMRTDGPR